MRATSVLLLLLATSGVLAQDVTLDVVLARLHRHLRDYAELLPATVAVERYHQSVGAVERVVLESEFGIVRVPHGRHTRVARGDSLSLAFCRSDSRR